MLIIYIAPVISSLFIFASVFVVVLHCKKCKKRKGMHVILEAMLNVMNVMPKKFMNDDNYYILQISWRMSNPFKWRSMNSMELVQMIHQIHYKTLH